MRITTLAAAGLVGALPRPAHAAPSELLNKTITVSYTVTIPARGADGRMVPGVRNAIRTIYISSAGRAFGRVNRRDGSRRSETKEAGPGANTLRFEGARLVGVMSFVSGAARLVITFGQGGQSCDASILIGRDNGKTLKWKGVNGMRYEATGPASVSNVRCSIRSGNAFSDE